MSLSGVGEDLFHEGRSYFLERYLPVGCLCYGRLAGSYPSFNFHRIKKTVYLSKAAEGGFCFSIVGLPGLLLRCYIIPSVSLGCFFSTSLLLKVYSK